MLLEAIYPLLAGDADLLAALVGGIHQSSLPEVACRPAMTYMVVGGSGNPTFDTPGVQRVRIQFDAYGNTRTQAANALDLLRLLLNGFQGTLGNGIRLQNVDLINPEPMDFPVEQYSRDFRSMSEYYFYFTFIN